MNRDRCLSMGVVVAMLFQLTFATTAAAQVQAMPPSTATANTPAGVYGGLGTFVPTESPSAGEIRVPGYPQPEDEWTWQVVPTGVIWHSYMADAKDSRIGLQAYYEDSKGYKGWLWDATAGARVGLLRYGSNNPAWPEGFELDAEGAAFPRLYSDWGLMSVDFRGGCPLTYRQGPWEAKFAYQHECSHLSDIYIEQTPGVTRINYIRDEIVLGVAYRPFPALRVYSQVGWAFRVDGGADRWDLNFGIDYSPVECTGFSGSPFAAINSRLRQELNFGGEVTFEAGWQWRGQIGQVIRTGLFYFNGMSNQFQWYQTYENQIGVGLWYDF